MKVRDVHNIEIFKLARNMKVAKSKKGDKDQELIQSSTTPDPGYHMGKWQKYN